tara:strand:- start:1560 stop:1907 length:348 start_codon:yes stop_codon:yes gene_type:complete
MVLLERLEQLATKYPNNMELGKKVRELVYQLVDDIGTVDKWKVDQFNRNRAQEDQVSTIEEMEEKVKELFSDAYIFERDPNTGKTYRRVRGNYDDRVEVDNDGNPIPQQLELFDE